MGTCVAWKNCIRVITATSFHSPHHYITLHESLTQVHYPIALGKRFPAQLDSKIQPDYANVILRNSLRWNAEHNALSKLFISCSYQNLVHHHCKLGILQTVVML